LLEPLEITDFTRKLMRILRSDNEHYLSFEGNELRLVIDLQE